MRIEFDPEKNAWNIRERDLSFERAADFDFETALIDIDERLDYGEVSDDSHWQSEWHYSCTDFHHARRYIACRQFPQGE